MKHVRLPLLLAMLRAVTRALRQARRRGKRRSVRDGRPRSSTSSWEAPSLTVIVRNLAGLNPAVTVRFQVNNYEGIGLGSGSAERSPFRGENRA